MSSLTADSAGTDRSVIIDQGPPVEQKSSVPTTAAPSAEAVMPAKKKNSQSKSKKKRQHAALQSMISQLKQLCNQVGQQSSLIDVSPGQMLPPDNLSGSSSPMDLDIHRAEHTRRVGGNQRITTNGLTSTTATTVRGMRIPPSVWKPQSPPQSVIPHMNNNGSINSNNLHAFRDGFPPQNQIRLTAAEREGLQLEERQKEIRMKLRCAVSLSEFETLQVEAEKANMKYESDLAQKKIDRLREAAQIAA